MQWLRLHVLMEFTKGTAGTERTMGMNDILPFCQCTLPTRTAEADAVATVSIAAASMAIAIAAAVRSEAIKISVAVVRAVVCIWPSRPTDRLGLPIVLFSTAGRAAIRVRHAH